METEICISPELITGGVGGVTFSGHLEIKLEHL